MKHWTPYGGRDGQGCVLLRKDGNCHSSCHRETWPLGHRGLPLAQLGRHSLTEETWVAKGTEVLISTVAVRFVFCILGVILGVSEGAGNLDK